MDLDSCKDTDILIAKYAMYVMNRFVRYGTYITASTMSQKAAYFILDLTASYVQTEKTVGVTEVLNGRVC